MALKGALRGLAGLVWGIVCEWDFKGLRLACGAFLVVGRVERGRLVCLRWSGVVSRNVCWYCRRYEMR